MAERVVTMRCPACENRDLVEQMTDQGVLVDACEGCRGVWLERGEVFECSNQPAKLQRALDRATLSGERKSRECPRCREELVGISFLEDDLWVDLCGTCRGIWFDEGELERAVGVDAPTFDLETDESAALEVDWEAYGEALRSEGGRTSGEVGEVASAADGGAQLEVDWEATGDAPDRAGQPPDAESGGDNLEVDWDSAEQADAAGNDWQAPGERGIEDPRANVPSTAVTSPAAAATRAVSSVASALPNLALRSMGVLVVLYGILGAVLIALAEVGYLTPGMALGLGVFAAVVQFTVSPWMMDLSLDWVYRMHWASRRELPEHLDDFIVRVCREEGIDSPDFGIIHDGAPNAFTYGHTPNNARIVITEGLIEILEPRELEAVVAHEIGHARNWDMLLMTAANLVPVVLYFIYRMLLGDSDNRNKKGAQIGIAAFLLYIVSQYVILFLSRTREYHADRYAGQVTGDPNALAAALVRIGYGLASGGNRNEEDDDKAGFRDNAFGAFGVFDADAANAMAISSYDHETVRAGASSREGVEASDIDRERLIGAMRWDLWNPWAKFYELNSTHPLVADRLDHLADQAEAFGQQPFVRFDATKPESYWDEFAVDCLVHIGPLAMVALAVVVGGSMYAANGAVAPFGALLMVAGLSYVGRTIFAYPSSEFPDHSVASCLKHVKVSGIRGVPVSIDGTLIGRGMPGLIWSEDFVLQDETGILFLDYRQPLRIWEFLFGLLRNADYQDQPVRLKGWYRRSPVPYVELKELHVGADVETTYVYHVKIAVGAMVALFGLGLLVMV